MTQSNELSIDQLRQALKITEQIDALKKQLSSILGGGVPSAVVKGNAPTATRRKMSAATRAKMSAAQQARRAKAEGQSTQPAAAPAAAPKKGGPTKAATSSEAPKKRGLTPEGRAKLAAAMKARWAARKKGAPAPNVSAK
jgi:hypothetical protein